jgi:hypothetical protein
MLGLVSYDSDDNNDNDYDTGEVKSNESVLAPNNIILSTNINDNTKSENELNVNLITDAQKKNNSTCSSNRNESNLNSTKNDASNIQKKYQYLDLLPSIIRGNVDLEAEHNVNEYLRMKQEENFNLTEVFILYILQTFKKYI